MFSTARVTVEAPLETVEEFSGLFGFLNETISFNSSDKSYKGKTGQFSMGIKDFACRYKTGMCTAVASFYLFCSLFLF